MVSSRIESSGSANLYNFKVEIELQEPLYMKVESPEPEVTLVRQVRPKGEKLPIYGKLGAEKQVDKWILRSFEITDSPTAMSGVPLVKFGTAYVANTAEAENAIRDAQSSREAREKTAQARIAAAAAAERERLAAQAAAEREQQKIEAELHRIAEERKQKIAAAEIAKREAEAAAIVKRHIDAVATANRYEGMVTSRSFPAERIELILTKSDKLGYEGEVRSSIDPQNHVVWRGTVERDEDGYVFVIWQIVHRMNTTSKLFAQGEQKFVLRLDAQGVLRGGGGQFGQTNIVLRPLSAK